MLDAKGLVQLKTLWDEVRVELVELLVEKGGEVLWQLVGLLQTASESIGQSGDIRHMVVLSEFWLILDYGFEITLVIEKPFEETLLDLLVVLLFEEIVVQELHGAHHEQFTAFQGHVESTNGSVSWETNRARTQNGATWFADIESRAVWVDKFESTVLISIIKVILGVAVLSGKLAFLLLFFVSTSGSNNLVKTTFYLLDELFRKATISNKGLFGMEVLVEGLSNHAVRVYGDANLLEHRIDIGVQFGLATLVHKDDTATALLDVASDILQLLSGEWQFGAAEEKEVVLFQLFEREFGLINLALVP